MVIQRDVQAKVTREVDDVVLRVVEWNAARRGAVSEDLEVAMLEEERQEYEAAETDVERADALGDMLFVAIGTIWKSSHYEARDITDILWFFLLGTGSEIHSSNQAQHKAFETIRFVFDEYPTYFPSYVDVMNVICDSNDTKPVPRVGRKGVKVPKGSRYKSPVEGLKELFELES